MDGQWTYGGYVIGGRRGNYSILDRVGGGISDYEKSQLDKTSQTLLALVKEIDALLGYDHLAAGREDWKRTREQETSLDSGS